jgi:sterol desaturase/sphingolipid hydroxylase (fatty acid hydroxylase superfamily)
MNTLLSWPTLAITGGTFASMLALERRFPLRHAVERKMRRVVRNLTVAAVAWPALTLVQAPLVILVAGWAGRHRVGVLNWIELPYWLELGGAILLLDYTLWHWHWLNHRVPFLWRFHLAHHVDRDLDASTALRFHFGELAFSIGFRALQVLAIGVDPLSMATWETVVFVSILFHHSNTRIPIGIERVLVKVVVTPRMHGIHHSDREGETNSNWSSFLSIWDYAHRTARLNVPQQAIVIGVPAYGHPADVTIGKVLTMPFRRQRADWRYALGEARGGLPTGPQTALLE